MSVPEQRMSPEERLIERVTDFFYDPLEFVMWVMPWGVEGTRLAQSDGPDKWQVEACTIVRDRLLAGERVKIAVGTGHGVGKTAWVAWMIHWFASTRPYPQIVCTANTEQQLNQKTWRELRKWQSMAINGYWFEWSATSYRLKSDPGNHFASAVAWSRERPEAFAGTHERYVLMVFDEASAIADEIWETAEGAMTTAGSMWIATGNLTRNTGRFRECFRRFRKRWDTINVDSRDSSIADPKQIQEWVDDYGLDSDFVRVRVLGKPPKAATTQFISEDVVEKAEQRDIDWTAIPPSVPKLMGVDIARYGDDESKIVIRQGRKMSPKIRTYRGQNLMNLAGYIAEAIVEEQPDTVFVEGTGIGAGVVDRLIQLGFDNVIEVLGGSEPSEGKIYYNARTEMWARMRKWLEGADIPENQDLHHDLIAVEYGFMNKKQLLQVEPQEKMKERGLDSPDTADALRATFYQAVPMKRELEGLMSEPEVV